jgi:hypothetical protein
MNWVGKDLTRPAHYFLKECFPKPPSSVAVFLSWQAFAIACQFELSQV